MFLTPCSRRPVSHSHPTTHRFALSLQSFFSTARSPPPHIPPFNYLVTHISPFYILSQCFFSRRNPRVLPRPRAALQDPYLNLSSSHNNPGALCIAWAFNTASFLTKGHTLLLCRSGPSGRAASSPHTLRFSPFSPLSHPFGLLWGLLFPGCKKNIAQPLSSKGASRLESPSRCKAPPPRTLYVACNVVLQALAKHRPRVPQRYAAGCKGLADILCAVPLPTPVVLAKRHAHTFFLL